MRFAALLVSTTIAVAGLSTPAAAAAGDDRDCGDFGSQQAAQLFFLNNNPAADPHGLDSNGDGVVCESNPGPYYYGSDPTPGSNDDDGGGTTPPPQNTAPAPLKVVKVISGDLVRLRQGSAKPYDVRLVGLKVSKDSCTTKGSRDFLRNVAKPGRVVVVITDKKAPKRDTQGHLVAEVRPKNGNAKSGFSHQVVKNGWAKVQSYKFAARKTYKDMMAKADDARQGLFGNCIKDYGSSRHPYEPGTAFEVDGWRFNFGVTDLDALPEMTAEQAAAAPGTYSFTPPTFGSTYARVLVTATRIDGPPMMSFGHISGDSIRYTNGWCGTAPNLVEQMTVAEGQTVSGYLCTKRAVSDEVYEMWAIDNLKSSAVRRFVDFS